MTDRQLSIRSPEALKGHGLARLADADLVAQMRVGLESARVPRWALGGLDPQSDRMADRFDTYWDNRWHELEAMRLALTGQGRSLVRVLEAIDEQDAVNAMTLLGRRTGDPAVTVSAPTEVPRGDGPGSPASSSRAHPKGALVEDRVELPGWQEPTYRYTDPDGRAFELPAPGLPPVQVGVSTVATFHDFSISTESDDDLERVMARYGRQLEEAELIGRAMGSDRSVLGPYVLPLWLSSPDAVDGAAERLTPTVTRFDRDLYDGYGRAVRGVEAEWSGAAQRAWRADVDLSLDLAAALRTRLFTMLGYTHVVADRLRAARNACAAIVDEYQLEILAAKDQLLRELTGDSGDPLAALLDLNPTTPLLTVYESAVARMNNAIEHTAVVDLEAEPDGESIRARLRQLGLVDDGVMVEPVDLAARADRSSSRQD